MLSCSADLKHASTGDLFVQLSKNCMRRSAIVSQIINAELPDAMKIGLIKSTFSGLELDTVERLVENIGLNPESTAITDIINAVNWDAISATADVVAKKSASAPNRKRKQPEKAKTWVYFVESRTTGRIKIGKSIDPKKRIGELKRMSPDELVLIGYMPEEVISEYALHQRFSHHRMHGEWFEGHEELRKYIETLDLTTA